MTASAPPTRPDRWSGACLVAAGLLLVPGALHPDIFGTTLADAAAEAVWVPIHVIGGVAVVLALFGLTGLYWPRAERLGRLGAVGFALAVVGLVMAACVAYVEALLLPVIARDDPEVFDWDGPVTTSWAVRTTTGMALLWLLGLVLVGLSLWRAGVVPAGAALTLAGGAVAFTAFGGPLVPVLAPLSILALAAGHVWIGLALGTGAAAPAAASRRPRATAGGRRERDAHGGRTAASGRHDPSGSSRTSGGSSRDSGSR
jgi:hypothetical protein